MKLQNKTFILTLFFAFMASACPAAKAMEQNQQVQQVCNHCREELGDCSSRNPLLVHLECGHIRHKACLLSLVKSSKFYCAECGRKMTGKDKAFILQGTLTADSLTNLTIKHILRNKDLVIKALTSMPADIFTSLVKALSTTLENTLIAPELKLLVESPRFPLDRACDLRLKYSRLESPELTKRITDAVENNQTLSGSAIECIIKLLKPRAITSRTFAEMLPKGIEAHKQAQQIARALYAKHLKEIQFMRRNYWNCFRAPLDPFSEKPANDAFISYPLQADFEKGLAREIATPEDAQVTYAYRGCTYADTHSTTEPAVRNADKTLIAVHVPDADIIEIHQTTGTIEQNNALCTRKLLDCPCNKFDCDFGKIADMAFSTDNRWLRLKDLNDQVVYFLLPIDYISGNLSIAQIVFIRVLQQLTLDLNYKKYMTIGIAYKLYESKLLDSFNASERSMFTGHLQEQLTALRDKRKAALVHSSGTDNAALSDYFFSDELEHLLADMMAVDHSHLKKKMCRYMLESLQRLVPEKDFSPFKVKYSEDKDMPKVIQAAFTTLLIEYLKLEKKMPLAEFKASFLAWVNKAYKHALAC